jgi:hypothetical protein
MQRRCMGSKCEERTTFWEYIAHFLLSQCYFIQDASQTALDKAISAAQSKVVEYLETRMSPPPPVPLTETLCSTTPVSR